jgi:hypothetical protein
MSDNYPNRATEAGKGSVQRLAHSRIRVKVQSVRRRYAVDRFDDQDFNVADLLFERQS